MVEARRSLARDTVGRLRATCSKAPLDHAYIGGMPAILETPAAALIGEDANSAVVIFREKNATDGVSHKVVANATTFRTPLRRVQYLTVEIQELLQQPKVALLQSGQGSVAN